MGRTFALDEVEIELLQRPHGYLLQLFVHEEQHEGIGYVFTSRHARRLRHLILQFETV